MRRFLILLLSTFAATPALAGATAWQELAPGARARLVSADTVIGGEALAGLELDLQPGVKTYWRVPGETGIPTTLDFAGSEGVSGTKIDWPYPEIDEEGGYRDYVYRGHIVLPLRLDADADRTILRASLALGICTDVCVPANASFELPISFGRADGPQRTRINIAMQQTPLAWDRPDAPFATLEAGANGLVITAPDSAIDPQSLIADIGDPAVLFGAPQPSADRAGWTVPLLGGGDATNLVGKRLELTFNLLGSFMAPYSVTAEVAAGAP
jgi:DsbC/DsbD-like thiol-disulfide interchange protein